MIYIGIDDTDNREGGGTGRVARAIADVLRHDWPVVGVSRHQLLVDPRVPYTSNNSCNVIHLAPEAPERVDRLALALHVQPLLLDRCLPGSDPGLCVGGSELAGHPFGTEVQQEVVTQSRALSLAESLGVFLRPLGGTGDGVVGALAGVILAASGNDGRFVERGRSREADGILTVTELLVGGIDGVRTREGLPVVEGLVDTCGRVRPVLEGHRAVLLVEPGEAGMWRVVELGKPKHPREEVPCTP